MPPDVIELAQAGKTLEAVKRYREVTGAGSEDAIRWSRASDGRLAARPVSIGSRAWT